jgi:hypothetical protein
VQFIILVTPGNLKCVGRCGKATRNEVKKTLTAPAFPKPLGEFRYKDEQFTTIYSWHLIQRGTQLNVNDKTDTQVH